MLSRAAAACTAICQRGAQRKDDKVGVKLSSTIVSVKTGTSTKAGYFACSASVTQMRLPQPWVSTTSVPFPTTLESGIN